jgi:hypothetical protein
LTIWTKSSGSTKDESTPVSTIEGCAFVLSCCLTPAWGTFYVWFGIRSSPTSAILLCKGFDEHEKLYHPIDPYPASLGHFSLYSSFLWRVARFTTPVGCALSLNRSQQHYYHRSSRSKPGALIPTVITRLFQSKKWWWFFFLIHITLMMILTMIFRGLP